MINRFRDRSVVVDDLSLSELQAFIVDFMPIDHYIEVRTVPA